MAAAGLSSDLVYGDMRRRDQKALSKKVLRRELSTEDAQRQREAEARRKRVRRIQVDKEDRDALRELDQTGLIRSDPFVLVSGDVITNIDLASVIKEHEAARKKDK